MFAEEDYYTRDCPYQNTVSAIDECENKILGKLEGDFSTWEDVGEEDHSMQAGALLYISNDMEDLLEIGMSVSADGVLSDVDVMWYCDGVSGVDKMEFLTFVRKELLERDFQDTTDVDVPFDNIMLYISSNII